MSSTYSTTVATQVEDEEPIPMSELVRIAEASRLRRRGAITGGHRANRQSTSSSLGEALLGTPESPWARPPPNQIVVPPPPWTDVGPAGPAPQTYPPWADVPDPTKADDDADSPHASGYALYCGLEDWEFGDEEPYEPSPLPVPLDELAPRAREPQRFRKSTGCGALIHSSGTPRTRSGTWQARGKATKVVIALDKMYFERGGQPKQFACGCRWHGVGCSNCGNALGNIYMPCQAATATSSLPRDQSRGSRSARPPTSASAHYVYTFFCNAVTPSPAFEFPESATVHAHDSRATIPSASTAGGERGSAAQGWEGVSVPGDESEYTYGYPEQEQETETEEPGAEYDPDGMLIVNEPGSPDKPSAEAMLWPAR